eukprot:34466_1
MAAQIMTFDCLNQRNSDFVMVSTAKRSSVHTLDIATGQTVRTDSEAHRKPVHCVAVNHASAPVWLTAACDDTVLMWDLRSQRSVMRFSGHRNRSAHIACALSPCERYMACGSEDNSGYIFDVRQGGGTWLERLTGHTDVVSGVSWNP